MKLYTFAVLFLFEHSLGSPTDAEELDSQEQFINDAEKGQERYTRSMDAAHAQALLRSLRSIHGDSLLRSLR